MAQSTGRRNARRGFGPKALFFGTVLEHFRQPKNLERLLTAFTGAACEQWINCEAFMALRAELPHAWIYPEWSKRDVALFASDEDEHPALLMETKVLYASYSEKKQLEKLRALAAQLAQCRKLVGADAPRNAVVGLVVSFDWAVTSSGETTRPRPKVAPRDRMPRSLLDEAGLENAFHHKGGRTLEGLVKTPGGHIDVEVRLEMVRLAG